MATIELVSSVRSFGGWIKRFRHHSKVLGCEMVFGVYLPPAAETGDVPVLWWLSGLTCTDQNFMQKAGAQRVASALGIAIVCPDTSPRGSDLPGEHDSYDFGSGAGFYVNATEEPWRDSYQMYAYVTEELPAVVAEHLPVNGKEAISGHSMGGHGALICALKQPGRYASVTAFAPIAHPMECPWGIKAFAGYLGSNRADWEAWDATALVKTDAGRAMEVLVDQGTADDFYAKGQLLPEALQEAAAEHGMALTLRMQEGYDHGYDFIATFVEDHIRWAAARLG